VTTSTVSRRKHDSCFEGCSALYHHPLLDACENADGGYRGTSLIRNNTPLRTAMGPYAYAYCSVLGGGVFL